MKTYYQVKPQFADKLIGEYKSKGTNMFYVADELFTESEVKKFGVNVNYCNKIQANPRKTYFCFGTRFLNKG